MTYIPAELRRLVVARAEGICEYCLIAEDDTFYGCEADHILSEKHGGATDADNLAMACVFCNQAKGSDIGSIDWESNAFVRFFNPRTDAWAEHFALINSRIEGISPVGIVTARILGYNAVDRVLERRTLQGSGRYPCAAALRRIGETARDTQRQS
ncbi:MAG TPA: HNH endonuclease signature motif containing protein [Gemmataceae bacterium]